MMAELFIAFLVGVVVGIIIGAGAILHRFYG